MANEFGRWLGESNGKEMIASIFKDNNLTAAQAAAVVTTYCLLFDVKVDTMEWDKLIAWLWLDYGFIGTADGELENESLYSMDLSMSRFLI